MPGVTERTLAVLEFLATQMEGTPLAMIADRTRYSEERVSSACSSI